jgi:hypothetical protein
VCAITWNVAASPPSAPGHETAHQPPRTPACSFLSAYEMQCIAAYATNYTAGIDIRKHGAELTVEPTLTL